ncbi:MAG: hypothetical protein M3Z06_05650 [Actinomycetota bacterium]|nr:hypothetical protein [Actinomycetota bacterium]
MTRNPLLIDLAIAVLCALVVLIVSPGVAVDAIVALAVLVLCGVSAVIGRRRGRGHRSIAAHRARRDNPLLPRRRR